MVRRCLMTIAEQIRAEFNGKYEDGFVKKAESMATDIDQQWKVKKTIYTFKDGSKLIWSGPFLEIG